MLSFYCYRQILEHLHDSGRSVICHVTLKTKRGHRKDLRVAFDELRTVLDSDLDFMHYNNKPLQFKDVDGQKHFFKYFNLQSYYIAKVEILKRDSDKVLVFHDFMEIAEYMQSHGKKVVAVISIWTHDSPRMVFTVPLNEMKKHLTKSLHLKHVAGGVLTFKTTDGQTHSYEHNKLRICKFDHILIS